jgi:membrane protein implicated in regulation of membrane protease activity
MGDAFGTDLDADGDLDFMSISPFALAAFGATFGVCGLITHMWMGMEPVASILWATGLGLLIGILAQAFFIYVLAPSRSSHYSLQQDAVGREAEVVLTIPVDGIGQVAFNNVSGRVMLGARTEAVGELHVGERVVIEKVMGRVALVRPLDDGKKSLQAPLKSSNGA